MLHGMNRIFKAGKLSWFCPNQGLFLQKPGGNMVRTRRLFHTTSHHCWRWGKGTLWGKEVLSKVSVAEGARAVLCELFLSSTPCH